MYKEPLVYSLISFEFDKFTLNYFQFVLLFSLILYIFVTINLIYVMTRFICILAIKQ